MPQSLGEKLKIKANQAPDKPGVYIWRDKKRAPMYVGRAGSLKKRIQSYFRTQDPRIQQMVASASSLIFLETDSLLEAVVLEANLIKKYWPKYNVREKDHRSFVYLLITKDDADGLHRPIIARERELQKYFPEGAHTAKYGRPQKAMLFGPFQSYRLLKTALEIIRPIFPYSTCKPNQARPCFHYQIGLCPGVCINEADKEEYKRSIRSLALFFSGNKKRLINKLKKENPQKLRALQHVSDVALLAESGSMLRKQNQLGAKRIEGYDISHLSGSEPVGAMVVFEDGRADSAQYRLFKIRGLEEKRDDISMLKEVVGRRLRHPEWPYPDMVFVDGGLLQVKAVRDVLAIHKIFVPVVGLSKAGKHAGSAYATDKLVALNIKKTGKDLIASSKKLFQEVRNEAHRFSIAASRRQRQKRSLTWRQPLK